MSANDGCYKCRKSFVNYRSPDCEDSYPNPATYKPITKDSIATAKSHRSKKTVAAVVPTVTTMPTTVLPIAVVMPHMPTSVLGDGSD